MQSLVSMETTYLFCCLVEHLTLRGKDIRAVNQVIKLLSTD